MGRKEVVAKIRYATYFLLQSNMDTFTITGEIRISTIIIVNVILKRNYKFCFKFYQGGMK